MPRICYQPKRFDAGTVDVIDQDYAIVALFIGILVLCVFSACIGAVLNALDGKGKAYLFVSLVIVASVWVLTRS